MPPAKGHRSNSDPSIGSNKKHCCRFCGHRDHNKEDIEAHERSQHTGERLRCKTRGCDFTSLSQADMRRHDKNKHKKLLYGCPWCQQCQNPRSDNLRNRHMHQCPQRQGRDVKSAKLLKVFAAEEQEEVEEVAAAALLAASTNTTQRTSAAATIQSGINNNNIISNSNNTSPEELQLSTPYWQDEETSWNNWDTEFWLQEQQGQNLFLNTHCSNNPYEQASYEALQQQLTCFAPDTSLLYQQPQQIYIDAGDLQQWQQQPQQQSLQLQQRQDFQCLQFFDFEAAGSTPALPAAVYYDTSNSNSNNNNNEVMQYLGQQY